MTIDRDLDHLHPSMAARVRNLIRKIEREELPFVLFEGYRSPQRQAEVLANGKSKAGPFQSAHQFGLAADFAVLDRGDWRWPEAEDPIWDRLHACAYEANLAAPIAWDLGHISWPDWRKLV